MKRLYWHPVGLILTLAICCLVLSTPVDAADHRDAPLVNSNPALDINDIYAFQSPENPANVVMIITVNPFIRTFENSMEFATRGVYEFNVFNLPPNAPRPLQLSATPTFSYRFYFSPVRSGAQRFVVVQQNGQVLTSGATGKITNIAGGGRVTAGIFDDPFFFDSVAFNNMLSFSSMNARDNFRAANVSAIVLELPRSTFSNTIAVYSRTLNGATQFDRVGLPAINTVLIPPVAAIGVLTPALKNAFNVTLPHQDQQRYRAAMLSTLAALGNDSSRANTLADVLLPDVLVIDTSNPAGFLNGRRLEDDVVDAELNLLSNGAVPTDFVNGNDPGKTFLSIFPYLAPPFALPTQFP